MKKKYVLITLIILYFLIQIIKLFINQEYSIKYKIDKFTIYETKNTNYHFKITKDNMNFDFETKLNLEKQSIKKIDYYESDKYKCILPILKNNKTFSNYICYNGNYYIYDYIKGKDKKLDEHVKKYFTKENQKTIYKDDYIELYDIKYKSFSIESYKGIYIKNSKVTSEKLFTSDIYIKDISTYINNKYLVADYNQKYEFHKFYLIDILNNKKETIISDKAISIYSYIEGIYENKVYLLDTLNKKQYEIDIDRKTITLVGNEKGIKIYKNGKFETANIYESINDKIYFDTYNKTKKIARIDKVDNFYYYYKKVGSKYIVSRKNIQNPSFEIILFECDSIDNIIYDFDKVVYKDNEYINYYSDKTGIKKVAKYNELKFNESIKFNYIKESL